MPVFVRSGRHASGLTPSTPLVGIHSDHQPDGGGRLLLDRADPIAEIIAASGLPGAIIALMSLAFAAGRSRDSAAACRSSKGSSHCA
ncbi:hypothetical protein [Actinoplanes sp. OR16]|uniref:hypothetical protein n=1 Tax=Actinoplanes sp. OR16 TaxID=946334 RepID=UPI00135F1AA0|nr:hypothetical protein [Actinoplanes sp. OR16]